MLIADLEARFTHLQGLSKEIKKNNLILQKNKEIISLNMEKLEVNKKMLNDLEKSLILNEKELLQFGQITEDNQQECEKLLQKIYKHKDILDHYHQKIKLENMKIKLHNETIIVENKIIHKKNTDMSEELKLMNEDLQQNFNYQQDNTSS
ncbi:hypothetical protein TTHERM_01233320 (macronuclear) [Tetrahymena thermophila SB210]|uniref:Uncharacterized protein n=1 Tax=Tetrahymena thermophila (strain SB210) TaxID=312017 RepID=Q24DF4_TETTS|nr:hypothetical protein TTHERM_01233320 [Tetrahymena thermophila SB210]EAS05824.1 hypothetical protein TTHERM_01233320 [Tetrahymena thermophila SB210]|eukprot:XP_001026069.1 hypothetical protein TTHERM_01233320 [Tetrahymena thermophila SB210]